VRAIGYWMLAVGFLAGAFVSVRTEANAVAWTWFVPALLVAAAGVAMVRRSAHQETRQHATLSANIDRLRRAIDRIAGNIAHLDEEKEHLHPHDVHGRIDALFPADLAEFVEARETIAHIYGLRAYAEVMNAFAAGERYLNRVWSASVDCYVDDVREYLARAREQFSLTRDALNRLARD
jgi:hypothetical protein